MNIVKRLRLLPVFLAACFSVFSCDFINGIINPVEPDSEPKEEDKGSEKAVAKLSSVSVLDMSGAHEGEEVSSLFAISLVNCEFSALAAEDLKEGESLDDLVSAAASAQSGMLAGKQSVWAHFEVARAVNEGDQALSIKVSGKRGADLELSLALKQAWINKASDASPDIADDMFRIPVALSASASAEATPDIAVSCPTEIVLASSGSSRGIQITLTNMRFTQQAADAFGQETIISFMTNNGIVSVGAGYGISVVQGPEEGGQLMALRITRNSSSTQDGEMKLAFNPAGNSAVRAWFDVTAGNANAYGGKEFVFKIAASQSAAASPGASLESDRIRANAGENFSGKMIVKLSNLRLSGVASEVLKEGYALKSLSSGSWGSAGVNIGKTVQAGDSEFEISVSGTASASATGLVSISFDVKREWLMKARSNMADIPSDGYELRINLVFSTADSQAFEITGTTPVPVAAKGKNLYTITVHYPSGEYTGEKTASFTLKGSGNVASGSSQSLVSKSVPTGTGNWSDMWDLNTINVNQRKVTGKYWFTDEVNKMKYYVTSGSSATHDGGYVKSAWNGVGLYSGVNESYWSKLSSALMNAILVDGSGALEKERGSFGLKEYNKDGTDYFYVIVCDFGFGSSTVSGSRYGGIAGAYASEHIRPGNESNGADIFYVNARHLEAVVKALMSSGESLDQAIGDAAEEMANTLLHEYMHYLMDANHLLLTEKEYAGYLDSATGTISTQDGLISADKYNRQYLEIYAKMFCSTNHGSIFWIEGTANHAPYRVAGQTDKSAVSSWLGNMSKWRPAINGSDSYGSDGSTESAPSAGGDSYAVYGAGGLFFSYISEKYGDSVANRFHSWHESVKDVIDAVDGKVDDKDQDKSKKAASDRVGDIRRITKEITGEEFKDVYLDFLYQCMSSLDDMQNSSGKWVDGGVLIAGCDSDFQSAGDWGFAEMLDSQLSSGAKKSNVISRQKTTSGVSVRNLPELSFVINKWNGIPDYFTLTGDDVKCYAVYF